MIGVSYPHHIGFAFYLPRMGPNEGKARGGV